MADNMQAIIFEHFGEPAKVLQVREVDIPHPKPGQIRVRMLASPINPSDLLTIRGSYGTGFRAAALAELPFAPTGSLCRDGVRSSL